MIFVKRVKETLITKVLCRNNSERNTFIVLLLKALSPDVKHTFFSTSEQELNFTCFIRYT